MVIFVSTKIGVMNAGLKPLPRILCKDGEAVNTVGIATRYPTCDNLRIRKSLQYNTQQRQKKTETGWADKKSNLAEVAQFSRVTKSKLKKTLMKAYISNDRETKFLVWNAIVFVDCQELKNRIWGMRRTLGLLPNHVACESTYGEHGARGKK